MHNKLKKGNRVQVVDDGNVLALVPLADDPVHALHGMLEDGYKFFRKNLDGIGFMPGPSEGAPGMMPPKEVMRSDAKSARLYAGKRTRLNCHFPCAENDEGGSALVTEEEDGSLTITVIENNPLESGEPSQSMASVRIGPLGTQILSDALADGWNGEEPPGDEYVEPTHHEDVDDDKEGDL